MSLKSTKMEVTPSALPETLLWDGKSEPISPTHIDLILISEPAAEWQLSDYNFDDDEIEKTIATFELKNDFDFSDELLDEDDCIDLLDLKHDENWQGSKFDTAPQSPNSAIIDASYLFAPTAAPQPLDASCYLPQIFNADNLTQLTPPQSPPHAAIAASSFTGENVCVPNAILATEPLVPSTANWSTTPAVVAANALVTNNAVSTPIVPPTSNNSSTSIAGVAQVFEEIAREAQLVDEIVNTRAQELIEWHDDGSLYGCSSPPSSIADDDSHSNSANSSSAFCSSGGSSPMHAFDSTFSSEHLAESGATISAALPKKRTRPYGRGVEDRKIRKKEQNKNAATRYRQKKKQEMELILSEEQELTQRNEELQKTLAESKREAKYLKTLIREFYKKKMA